MTNNQISYLNLQEQKRSHLANESFNLDSLAETSRHNVATEEFNLSNLAETVRSNKAREVETKRHNQRTEGESVRHNLATESIQKTSALAEKAYKEATAALNSAKLDFDKQKEVTRIAESLRDYLERVRANDLDALTSRSVASLVSELSKLMADTDYTSANNDQSTNVTVNLPNTMEPTNSQENEEHRRPSRGGGISRGNHPGGGISRGNRTSSLGRRTK